MRYFFNFVNFFCYTYAIKDLIVINDFKFNQVDINKKKKKNPNYLYLY